MRPDRSKRLSVISNHGIDHGRIVQSKVRIGGQRYLAKFAARNKRQVSYISWKADLCDTFLRPFQNHDSPEVPVLDDRIPFPGLGVRFLLIASQCFTKQLLVRKRLLLKGAPLPCENADLFHSSP